MDEVIASMADAFLVTTNSGIIQKAQSSSTRIIRLYRRRINKSANFFNN
jgi:hypothetical protein